ncbi:MULTISPECIES: MFS transporter [unclassified Methylobacterium]|jgi:ACS family tartrate transporter-like MFS transporter|uniref:MFS transporter n=1 Tax=unclassified Methylobacterium TaxID=2615210 RepID=UPI0013560111|nr:MFS transporter [Methylobacterium sp. 2A]MWV25320.1 MFS transporter [Methylobacterium sp. 2A]
MAAGIPTVSAAPEIERRTISKVSWRLLPLIVVIYFIAYMDRTNVGFASFGLNREFGFSATLYGWGAGIFFLGYFFFEVPSNVLLERTGARIWIARIMITWGLVAGGMAFIAGPVSFLVLRFLLGVAEAGFFPGMILYFTYWFPRKYRARVVAALFLAVPGSNALTAVISGALLQLDGVLGLHGWQWLFILEAAPSIVLAFVVLALMTDRPAKATWLAEDERRWLEDRLEAERRSSVKTHGHFTLRQALTDSRVLTLAAIYFTIVTATYGITFFMPPILKSLKLTDWETGLATAVPYIVGTIGMVSWSWSSDRRNERRWHFVIAAIVAAIGLIASGPLLGSLWALAAMSVATVGLYGTKPAFWPLPAEFLSGPAAAGGIALINAIGNLGGFVGPYVLGWLKDTTGTYEAGLYFLAGCALASAVLAFVSIRPQAPAAEAGAPGAVRPNA